MINKLINKYFTSQLFTFGPKRATMYKIRKEDLKRFIDELVLEVKNGSIEV